MTFLSSDIVAIKWAAKVSKEIKQNEKGKHFSHFYEKRIHVLEMDRIILRFFIFACAQANIRYPAFWLRPSAADASFSRYHLVGEIRFKRPCLL